MSDYMRNRRGDEANEGFFCRFTFGQFFAILVLEVCTLFFVFYLGARYGREFLGLDRRTAETEQAAPEAGATTAPPSDAAVLSTSDPEAAKVAQELIQKAQTPELKDRITKMFEQAQGGAGKIPEVVAHNRADEMAAAELPPTTPQGKTPGEQLAAKAPEPSSPIESVVEHPTAPPPAGEASAAGERRPQDAAAQAKAEGTPTKAEDAATKAQATDSSVIRVKSAENGRYAIQVGSYPQLAEATHVVDRWKGKGYPSYMMIADIPDRGRWYRVRIGGFATREDAARYLKEFQSRENVEALIVMNEQ